jgi:hypothetical protein
VSLSVIAFAIYNVALNMGAITNSVFPIALKEVPVLFILAFTLETVFVSRLAEYLAFKVVAPQKNRPIVIILAITSATICIMCPLMSFATTIRYNGFNSEFISSWLLKFIYNFPFAFFIQLFIIGPIVRLIFSNIFKSKNIPVLAKS